MQNNWSELKPYLNEEEFENLLRMENKVNYIHLITGKKIYKAMADGTLGGFDSFQMEGQLLALSNYYAHCERIKTTPLPRQYDYFTRVFIVLFAALLPFGLLTFFQSENTYNIHG